jgi:hypothetical protein
MLYRGVEFKVGRREKMASLICLFCCGDLTTLITGGKLNEHSRRPNVKFLKFVTTKEINILF